MRPLTPNPKFPPRAPRTAHSLLDMPVHRGSVGGMSVAAGVQDDHSRFRPYFYRGTGEDIYALVAPVETQPKPEPKPKKRRKAKPPPPWWSDRPRLNHAPKLPDPPYAPATYALWDEEREWVPEVISFSPRPAAGWKPPTGVDIDAWLEEFDD